MRRRLRAGPTCSTTTVVSVDMAMAFLRSRRGKAAQYTPPAASLHQEHLGVRGHGPQVRRGDPLERVAGRADPVHGRDHVVPQEAHLGDVVLVVPGGQRLELPHRGPQLVDHGHVGLELRLRVGAVHVRGERGAHGGGQLLLGAQRGVRGPGPPVRRGDPLARVAGRADAVHGRAPGVPQEAHLGDVVLG
ncbi:MAG: hypothetical protein ACK55I_16620, partial [bacterium]